MIYKKKKQNCKLYSQNTKKYSGNELLINEYINNNKTKKYNNTIHSVYNPKKDKYLSGGGNNISLGRQLFGKKIETINYERFDIANKEQFKQIKTDIRATRISAFIANKLGRISKLQYKLQMHLLKANLFFARMKLYNAKLIKIANILIYDDKSIIKTIHSQMNEIFELQKQINEGYISKHGTQTKLKPKKILKLIKKQDKIRYSILKLTTFENSTEITKGCTSTGKAMFYNKNKEFICILGRYRKYESKFNKYYHKFKSALEEYFSVYPNCSGSIKDIKLKALDITKITDEEGLFHDETKCDTAQLYEIQQKSFEELVKVNKTQLGEKYEEQTIGKTHKITEEYINSSKSLENTVNHFNTKLEQFKNFFKSLEFFGIHRYPGLLPRKKIFLQRLRGKKSYQLVNPKKLEELSHDKTFIQEFSEMIKQISKDAKDIFTPLDTEISKIIPNILIKQQITLPPPQPPIRQLDTIQHFTVLSINMDKFDYKITSLKLLLAPINTFNYPIIICINNGLTEMVNRDSAFNKSFLGNLYIPIAFSSHGNVETMKYNIIFLRKDAIEDIPDNPEYLQTLKPINQSSRFILNELPNGMTLENNQKSYAVANIIFQDILNQKKGISIVCTELVGSNPEDLYYAKKIIDFDLRKKQINNILYTVHKINGHNPDFIVGDLGGCDNNIINTPIDLSVNPITMSLINDETYIGYLWEYFQKNYPDFIPNLQNPGNLINFFTNGFDLLTNYNADSYISTSPYVPPPATGPNYTKKTLKILSNYILYDRNIQQNVKPNTSIFLNDINNYGGNLPIYLSYNVTNNITNILGKTPPLQSRIKTSDKIKLFTEKELQNILATIDKLMSVFAYGKVPYMRRDLGCFSLRDDNLFGNKKLPKLFDKKVFGNGQSLLKASIQDINYKHLDMIKSFPDNEDGIERLKKFYTMNYPSIIECFLFQKTGFFASNPKEKDELGYYSENQTVMTVDNEGKLETMPVFGNKLKILKQEGLVNPDIAIRMLLMPSSHIKLIMDIDLRNQLTNQISAKDYKKLTKLALQNFYGKYALNLLETRLSLLLDRNTYGDNNIIAHLMELTPEGNLQNLNDPTSGEIILDLFEIIFIFLRMKFIDKQLELYEEEVKKIEKPLIEIEEVAKQTSKYKKDVIGIYDNITDIISTYNNPLQIILYSDKVDRLSNPDFILNPSIISNPESLSELVKSFPHKDIKYKPIEELEKGGISGLQYYETYISSLLGKRIDKIYHILKVQTITDIAEYQDFFTKDLPDNLDILLDNAKILHKSIQSTNISDVTIGNKIYARINELISKLKQLNEQWVSYFQNIITLLGYYYSAIQFLIVYENTTENLTPINPPINDIFKHDNIFNEIKHIRDKVFEDTPERVSIITSIRNLPYQLSQDMEIIANQIQQIYNRIDSKLYSEVSFEIIHSLKPLNKYSTKQIFTQYPVSIYHVALRSSYLMFNKIKDLFTISDPNVPKINYAQIMNICDYIEISFNEISKIKDREKKAHLSSGKITSINKNDIIYFENQEILTKISRMIWAICNLLKDGTASYDTIKINLGDQTIKLTELFNTIIKSIEQLNDKLHFQVSEICYYIMKPINLVVNLMYYITNVFTKNTMLPIENDEYVLQHFNDKNDNPTPSLFNRYQQLLENGNHEHLYKVIYSFRNNINSNRDMFDSFKSLFTLYNTQFQEIYIDNINLINNNNLHLNSDFSLSNNQLILTANNLNTDTIFNIYNIKNPNKENYNEFLLKSISKLQKQDNIICSLIRDFQTNDDCTDENNSKRLEYEIKYKPSIFNNTVGEILTIDTDEQYNTTYLKNIDNSMAYLFLDVLDYYKKNHDELIKQLTIDINPQINNLIISMENNPTNPQAFTDGFEKMLFKMDDTSGRKGNNYNFDQFINKFKDIINFIDNDDNIIEYIIMGSNVSSDFPRTEKYEEPYNRISGQKNMDNIWEDIYDYNLLGILKRFSCVKRFYNTDMMRNHNLIQEYIDNYNAQGLQKWYENKKNYVFNIQYFKDIYFSNHSLNNYIDTFYLKNYFLNVIYQNCFLETNQKITKEIKIKLIIYSIYILSYLLNHDITGPNFKTEKILDFGFIILGVSSLIKFMPSSYFTISNIINNENEDKWLDTFVNKFFKEYLSYYCKKNDEVVKLNNELIIDYVKSLSIYKANKFAHDVINDTNKILYDNTYKFINFINTFDITKLSIDDKIFEDIIKINYQIKKLEVLIGTTTKGVLQDYLEKLNNEHRNNVRPVLHPYFIIDYLDEINFYNIYNEIIKNIRENENIFEYYFNHEHKIMLDEDDFIKYINNEGEDEEEFYKKGIDKKDIIQKLLNSDPTMINHDDLTKCYNTDLIKVEFINHLQNFVEKIIEIRDLFMFSFFHKLFGSDNYYIIDEKSEKNKDKIYKDNGPLFNYNKMMKHLLDCIEFIISYSIINDNEITNNMDILVNKTKNIITMIFDIFKNELNNTVVSCFSYNDQKIIKNITDNINKVININKPPNYEWNPTIYNESDRNEFESSDKIIFNYIYTLLNCKDEKNNYYLISNSTFAGKNIFEKYSIDAKNNDTDFNTFHDSIINNSYLLNNNNINLNNEEIQFILKNTQQIIINPSTNIDAKFNNVKINPVQNNNITFKLNNHNNLNDHNNKTVIVIQSDNYNNKFEGIIDTDDIANNNLTIKNITNILGNFDNNNHVYNIYLIDSVIKDNNALFQYFISKTSKKYFDYMINEFSNVNYNYISKTSAAGQNNLPNPVDHKNTNYDDIKARCRFIEKYDAIMEILNTINNNTNQILATTNNLIINIDFDFNLDNIKNNINVIKNNYRILNDNNFLNINNIPKDKNKSNYLYYLNFFCIKDQINIIVDGIFNNFDNDDEKQFNIVEIIDQYIIKDNIIDNIVKNIDNIYNGVKKDIKFSDIQQLINQSNNSFNDIITDIRNIRDLFIKKQKIYSFENISKNIVLIRNTENLDNVDEYLKLYNIINNEYSFIIDLLYGLEDGIKELFSLVPYSLNNPYVDKSLNHRNNLFIATNVLGYMNTKIINFSIKNNTYLNIKLDALLYSNYLKDKPILEGIKYNIDTIEKYFNKYNIFKIDDIPLGNYNVVIQPPNTLKFIEFMDAAKEASPKYPSDMNKQERCKVWTYPLFNFNYGNPVVNDITFKNPIARNNAKNIIMNFIKNNYYNETNAVNFLTSNINKAISDIFVPDNEISKRTKLIRSYYNDNVLIYKEQIGDIFKNIMKLIKDTNKENKDLLTDIITKETYIELTIINPPPPQPILLQLNNTVDTVKINKDMGILMNKLINNFANLGRLRTFITNFIIEIFKKYIIYQCMSNKYSISMNQFLEVINDFNTNITDDQNYQLSIYIYKFLKILSENENIDKLDNVDDLLKYHLEIFNDDYNVRDNVKILSNKNDVPNIKNLSDLFNNYISVATNNDIYNEFCYINPNYFDIIMQTYSKTLTLSNYAHGNSIEYDHNHIVNIDNNNLIYLELNNSLELMMKIYEKYKTNKVKNPTLNVRLLDMIKEVLLVNIYKKKATNGIKYLYDFNNNIKQIFNAFNTFVLNSGNNKLLLEGGAKLKEENNTKYSRKLDYFILSNKNKKNKMIKKTNLHKQKKTRKYFIVKNKKITRNIQML